MLYLFVALKIPLNKQKEWMLRRELELNAGIHLRLRGLASTHIVRYLGFVSFRDLESRVAASP